MKTLKGLMFSALLAIGIGTACTATAQTTAFSFSDAANSESDAGTSGMWFAPTTDIWVTSVGYYYGTNPDPHPVGIYDYTTQSLLSGSSVTITTSSTADGNFRYESVPFIHLVAGTDYVVAGLDAYTRGTNTNAWNPGGLAVASGISFKGYLADTTNPAALTFPSNTTWLGQPFFGPNFQYVTTPVPEPETYAMMLAGLGLMGFMARRRKQKAA